MDGARCLHDEARAAFDDMPIARCRRHLRQHLLTKDRKSLEAYDKLIQIPKNNKAAADRLYKQLDQNSVLHQIPRAHVCDAYLPAGVHSHGVRLTNAAEQFNWMTLPNVRQQDSLFRCHHVRSVHCAHTCTHTSHTCAFLGAGHCSHSTIFMGIDKPCWRQKL